MSESTHNQSFEEEGETNQSPVSSRASSPQPSSPHHFLPSSFPLTSPTTPATFAASQHNIKTEPVDSDVGTAAAGAPIIPTSAPHHHLTSDNKFHPNFFSNFFEQQLREHHQQQQQQLAAEDVKPLVSSLVPPLQPPQKPVPLFTPHHLPAFIREKLEAAAAATTAANNGGGSISSTLYPGCFGQANAFFQPPNLSPAIVGSHPATPLLPPPEDIHESPKQSELATATSSKEQVVESASANEPTETKTLP